MFICFYKIFNDVARMVIALRVSRLQLMHIMIMIRQIMIIIHVINGDELIMKIMKSFIQKSYNL